MPIEFLEEQAGTTPGGGGGTIEFLDEMSPEKGLAEIQRSGPASTLEYLDQKYAANQELSFDEWKTRRDLVDRLDFFDRHVGRNARSVWNGMKGLHGIVVGAMDEMLSASLEYMDPDKRYGVPEFLAQQKRMGSTVAEAGLLGATNFTDLVEGVVRSIGNGFDEYGQFTQEEVDQGGYAAYKERLKARQYQQKLREQSVLGTVAGGAAAVAGSETPGAVQRGVRENVMTNVAELGSFLTPTDPTNLIPFGVGARANAVGRGALRAGSATAEKVAMGANALGRAMDVGHHAERLIRRVVPEISDAAAARIRKWGSGLAWSGASAAAIGADDGTVLDTVAKAYALGRTGFAALDKGGQFAAALGRHAAQGPRIQSTLKRVARDPGVPAWAAKAASALERAGGTTAARAGRAGALGAGTGAAVGGGLTALTDAEETEVAEAIGGGLAAGGVLGVAGAVFNQLTGRDQAMRIDAERMLLAESIRARNGDEAAKAFYGLPVAEQLAIGQISALLGPHGSVEVLPADQFAARAGSAAAGVHIEPQGNGGLGAVVINADAQRPKGVTALHEFSHALAMRQNPEELTAIVKAAVAPEALAKYEEAYLDRHLAGRRPAPRSTETQFDEMGFEVRNETGRSDPEEAAAAREAAKKEIARSLGEDWLIHEYWAEKGGELLAGADLVKTAETGEWEPAAARNLRAQQSVLRSAGVLFDANGKPVAGQFWTPDTLSEAGEAALGGLLARYLKDLADYAPGVTSEATKLADADSGKGPALNLGKNGELAAETPQLKGAFRDTTGGGKESDFAKVTKDGKVELKSPAEINRMERERSSLLGQLFPRNGQRAERSDPLVAFRKRDDGADEISGSVMPDAFFKSDAFPEDVKKRVKLFQELMAAPGGETARMWYHQIGSGSNWAAAVRKRLGNVRATRRELRPISFLVSQAGNLGLRALDMVKLKARLNEASQAGKLDMWAGNPDLFISDLKTMLANWDSGRPGETGIGAAKHAAILDMLGKDDTRQGIIKTFRVDRMADVEPTGHTGYTFDYGKFKRRESPDDPRMARRRAGQRQRIGNLDAYRDRTDGADLTGGRRWGIGWDDVYGESGLAQGVERIDQEGSRGVSQPVAGGARPGRTGSGGAAPSTGAGVTVGGRRLAGRSAAEAARLLAGEFGNSDKGPSEPFTELAKLRRAQEAWIEKEFGTEEPQLLYDWVEATVDADMRRDGFEHDVYFPGDGERVVKATKRNTYGIMGDQTPASYLRRQALLNHLWPELDFRFHGIAKTPGERRTGMTSMRRIRGAHPEPTKLVEWLKDRGWKRAGISDYEHDILNIRISDAHNQNWIERPDGKMIPIDIGIELIDQDSPIGKLKK